ncbi:iron-containing redox enzyme family protein [Streptosporangium algeriense]|uniref:Iron-containing redox enzyme family protein n=1 Tax=Streptosporangium algeriense TaxID=1682748 RepID=A0ABW3DMF2_9ACTN
MIVGRKHFKLGQAEGDLKTFLNLKRYLDGRHTVAEIAEITGVKEDDVRDIVQTMHSNDLLRASGPMDSVPADVFAKQVDESCAMWAQQIGFHRLFSGIELGQLRREVFMGLIMETYHYVKSAPKHIATAIAHCDDPALEPILSEYFTEEWNHAGFLLETLVNMGVPKEQVESAHPIIGTWSLINNMCEIARTDTLSYLACTSLFEARESNADLAAESLRRIATSYGYPEGCVEPMISHMRLDVDAGHKGLLAEALEHREFVTARDAHRAVNNLHDLKHTYDQFHDQIVLYYSDISNYIPRLKVDYFSL